MEVSGRDRREGMKAVLYMVVVHVIVAGMNILYKLSVDGGRMSLRVLVAYRYMFGAAFLCLLAFFLQRKTRTRLTCFILGQAFCCAIFGASLNQNLYIAAMKMT
ncbi:WAT1-related protein At1g09380-like [Nymphaea colorata]|nr:WAT1-related protein At1g09380-like [Nymphaea colorata]